MQPQLKLTFGSVMLALALLVSSNASARANGVAFNGCDGCHGSSADPPRFSLTSEPAEFAPGDTVTLTLEISAEGIRGAGFFLVPDEGEFQLVGGQNTKLLSGGLVHERPLTASGGAATARVLWTAPAEPGGTDFQVYGLATNGDGARGGDTPGRAMASLAYGCSGVDLYKDLDRDGFGSSLYGTSKDCAPREGWVEQDGDCNENNEKIFPGQTEVCNERDDDCDGEVDEGTSPRDLYPDADGDGFGVNSDVIVGCVPPRGYADNADDCDDNNPSIHPDAVEECNGFDDNCNGRRDEDARDRCGVGLCERYSVSCFSDECYPGEPSPEVCNGLDDDCNGEVDDNAKCPEGQKCYMLECLDAEDADMLAERAENGGDTAAPGKPAPANGGTSATPDDPSAPDSQSSGGQASPAPIGPKGCSILYPAAAAVWPNWSGCLVIFGLAWRRMRRRG